MWWLSRVRLVLARRPWLYWLIAGTFAALAALQVWAAHDDALRSRDSWGTTRQVWVVSADVAAGGAIVAERHEYPVAVLAGDVVDDLPIGAIAARPLARGSVLTADAMVGDQAIAPDWVVVALAAEHAPTLVDGDGVTLFAGGVRLCDGRVVGVTEASVEAGVPPECAAQVSTQLTATDILLARHPWAPSRRT